MKGDWCKRKGHNRKPDGICTICGDGMTPDQAARAVKSLQDFQSDLQEIADAIEWATQHAAPPQGEK